MERARAASGPLRRRRDPRGWCAPRRRAVSGVPRARRCAARVSAGAPSFTLPPELALALFVAPVLLDAAYDASLRDLRDNWAPVTGLVDLRGRPHDCRRRRRRPRDHPGDALGAGDRAGRRRRPARRRRRNRRASPAAAAASPPDDSRRREPAERRERPPDLPPRRRRRRRGRLLRLATWRRRSCSRWPAAWSSARRWRGSLCALSIACSTCRPRSSFSSSRRSASGCSPSSWASRRADHGVLRGDRGADGARRELPPGSRIPSYAVWETVGVRAEHPGLHLHRPADSTHSRRAWKPADARAILRRRRRGPRDRHRRAAGLAHVVQRRRPVARPPVRVPSATADAAAHGRQRPGHLVGGHARHRLACCGTGASVGVSVSRLDRADRVRGGARHAGDSGADAQAAPARAQPARRRPGRPRSCVRRASARCRAGTARACDRRRRRSPTLSGRSSRRTSHPAGPVADAGDARARQHMRARIAGRSRRRGRLFSPCARNDEIGDDAFHQIEEELDWLEMAGRGTQAPVWRVDQPSADECVRSAGLQACQRARLFIP